MLDGLAYTAQLHHPARQDTHHEMTYLNVPKVASRWGSPDFADLFFEAISHQIWEFPLSAICTTGAPSTDEQPECSDLRYELLEPRTLRGSFAYAFTEETNIGCSDQHYTDRVRGRFYFTYDLHTGVMSVQVPQTQGEYDPEEF